MSARSIFEVHCCKAQRSAVSEIESVDDVDGGARKEAG